MSAHCTHDHHHHDHHHDHDHGAGSPRGILWIALVLNLGMFLLEVVASTHSGSVSLLADAADFAADAANFALSLAVLSMSVAARARAAQIKAASMAAFGVLVLARAAWAWHSGSVPQPVTMGVIAVLALAVNLGVAALLYAWRDQDANLHSVWLCTRNDALGNVAVGLAALGVFGTGTPWPDLIVATAMATLAIQGSITVLRRARQELTHAHPE